MQDIIIIIIIHCEFDELNKNTPKFCATLELSQSWNCSIFGRSSLVRRSRLSDQRSIFCSKVSSKEKRNNFEWGNSFAKLIRCSRQFLGGTNTRGNFIFDVCMSFWNVTYAAKWKRNRTKLLSVLNLFPAKSEGYFVVLTKLSKFSLLFPRVSNRRNFIRVL